MKGHVTWSHGSNLGILENILVLNVLVVAGVLAVGLDPANVFTPSITPFLETLLTLGVCTLTDNGCTHYGIRDV